MRYLLSPASYNLADPGSLPNLLLQHLVIVTIAMAISVATAVPLGVLTARHRRVHAALIAFAGLLYSIPAIALVAVLITVTGLSLGTIVIPLVLYNQLAIIRNTAAAVNGIDPLIVETARALGMNRRQMLRRVTLPLALPVIVAGLRVATVTTIGIASLAGFIGQGGLGALIFMNITIGDHDAIFAGAFAIAALAVAADLLMLLLQRALDRGRVLPATA